MTSLDRKDPELTLSVGASKRIVKVLVRVKEDASEKTCPTIDEGMEWVIVGDACVGGSYLRGSLRMNSGYNTAEWTHRAAMMKIL